MLTGVAHAMECTALFVMSIELNHQITAHILLPALVLWVDSQWLLVHPLSQRWVERGLPFYSFCFYGSTCSQERRRNVRLHLFICISFSIWTVVTVTAVIWLTKLPSYKAPWPSTALHSGMSSYHPRPRRLSVSEDSPKPSHVPVLTLTSEAEGISEAPFILVLALFNNRTASWNTIVASSEKVL